MCCNSFIYHDTVNLNELFIKADLMLADTTSAIQEFLIQKKPVVAFANNTKSNYLISIDEIKLLENALDLKVENLDQIYKNINSYIKILHPYNDGKSNQRVIDACLHFLHKDKSHMAVKPMNLIRKFKIRKKLYYFTFKSYNKPYSLMEAQNNRGLINKP